MESKLTIAVETKMNTQVEEKLRWFQVLASLYDIASPHMKAFTGLQCQALEQRIIDMEMLYGNVHILRQLLSVINNIPEPPEGEISQIKRHFEIALSSCVNASEALTKYVQFDECDIDGQFQLDNVLNALLTARHHSESTHRKLNFSPE